MSKPSYRSPAYWPDIQKLSDTATYFKQLSDRLSCVEDALTKNSHLLFQLNKNLSQFKRDQGKVQRSRTTKFNRNIENLQGVLKKLIRNQLNLAEKLSDHDTRGEEDSRRQVKFDNIKI